MSYKPGDPVWYEPMPGTRFTATVDAEPWNLGSGHMVTTLNGGDDYFQVFGRRRIYAASILALTPREEYSIAAPVYNNVIMTIEDVQCGGCDNVVQPRELEQNHLVRGEMAAPPVPPHHPGPDGGEDTAPADPDTAGVRRLLSQAERWMLTAPERRGNEFESWLAETLEAVSRLVESVEAARDGRPTRSAQKMVMDAAIETMPVFDHPQTAAPMTHIYRKATHFDAVTIAVLPDLPMTLTIRLECGHCLAGDSASLHTRLHRCRVCEEVRARGEPHLPSRRPAGNEPGSLGEEG